MSFPLRPSRSILGIGLVLLTAGCGQSARQVREWPQGDPAPVVRERPPLLIRTPPGADAALATRTAEATARILRESGRFREVRIAAVPATAGPGAGESGAAGVVLTLDVVHAHPVSRARRFWLGPLAGRADLVVSATLAARSVPAVATDRVEAHEGSRSIFGGTDLDLTEQVAERIADWCLAPPAAHQPGRTAETAPTVPLVRPGEPIATLP